VRARSDPLVARCFSRWRLSAIIDVSEMEKKPERNKSRKMAQICAHKGRWSTRDSGREDGKDYSRAEFRCQALRPLLISCGLVRGFVRGFVRRAMKGRERSTRSLRCPYIGSCDATEPIPRMRLRAYASSKQASRHRLEFFARHVRLTKHGSRVEAHRTASPAETKIRRLE